MKYTTRVQHIDGRTGTICPDLMRSAPGEVAVVYDGTAEFERTAISHLTDLGPENAVPEPKKCGAGHGAGHRADCCMFLTMVECGDLVCQRFTAMRWPLMFKYMATQRNPTEPYPACMNQGAKAAEIREGEL